MGIGGIPEGKRRVMLKELQSSVENIQTAELSVRELGQLHD